MVLWFQEHQTKAADTSIMALRPPLNGHGCTPTDQRLWPEPIHQMAGTNLCAVVQLMTYKEQLG